MQKSSKALIAGPRLPALAAALAFFAWPLAAPGAESLESPSLLWGGFDAGYAALTRSYSVTPDIHQSKFTFALRGGIQIDPRLLVGVEFGGFTLQTDNGQDVAGGEAISTRFLIVQVYPIANSTFFVRGGGGRVKYTNNNPGEGGASGSGGVLGIGYDFEVKRRDNEHTAFYITPSLDYSAGSFSGATSPPGVVQDQRYRAISARIGLTFR